MSVAGFTATPIGWKHTGIVATTCWEVSAAPAVDSGASTAAVRRDRQIRYLAVRMARLLVRRYAGACSPWGTVLSVVAGAASSTGETCAGARLLTAGAARMECLPPALGVRKSLAGGGAARVGGPLCGEMSPS